MSNKLEVKDCDVVSALKEWLETCGFEQLQDVFEMAFDGSLLEDAGEENIYHIIPSDDIFDISDGWGNPLWKLFHDSNIV